MCMIRTPSLVRARWGADRSQRKRGIGLSRRLLLVLSAGALAATGLFTSGAAKATTAASSTPSGGECQLAGTANFTPGLTANSGSFTYGFTGNLTGCQSNTTPASPPSGTVFAQNATGTGSCSSTTTSGTSVTTWSTGTETVVSYTTTGAGALVALQGTVVPSVTIGTTTYTTNEPSTPVGANAVGELTFSTASPTGIAACNTAGGLTQAVINGFIEIGQQ